MIEFFNEDCVPGMRRYPRDYFDLAIVDPPYYSGPEKRGYYGSSVSRTGFKRRDYAKGDDWEIPTMIYFRELERVCKHYIVWGCNYFDWQFAPGRIVWDKVNGNSTFSDAEIAATDLITTVRLFPYMWNGAMQGKSVHEGRVMQGNKKLNELRIHPTQKPIALYTWLLTQFAKPGWRILDTHVGSASSLIACYQLGFEAVGFEKDPKYYAPARERLDRAMAQVRLMDIAGGDALGIRGQMSMDEMI